MSIFNKKEIGRTKVVVNEKDIKCQLCGSLIWHPVGTFNPDTDYISQFITFHADRWVYTYKCVHCHTRMGISHDTEDNSFRVKQLSDIKSMVFLDGYVPKEKP